MRLQRQEIQTILQVAHQIYGEKVKVYLFGSRLDDTKRGGDIDLLVRNEGVKKGILARIRMIAQLKYLLGDQKIDIIGDHEESLVAQEALRKGVLLVRQTENKKSTNACNVNLTFATSISYASTKH